MLASVKSWSSLCATKMIVVFKDSCLNASFQFYHTPLTGLMFNILSKHQTLCIKYIVNQSSPLASFSNPARLSFIKVGVILLVMRIS